MYSLNLVELQFHIMAEKKCVMEPKAACKIWNENSWNTNHSQIKIHMTTLICYCELLFFLLFTAKRKTVSPCSAHSVKMIFYSFTPPTAHTLHFLLIVSIMRSPFASMNCVHVQCICTPHIHLHTYSHSFICGAEVESSLRRVHCSCVHVNG